MICCWDRILAFIRLIMNLGDIRLWRVWLSVCLPLLLILPVSVFGEELEKQNGIDGGVEVLHRSDYNYSEEQYVT